MSDTKRTTEVTETDLDTVQGGQSVSTTTMFSTEVEEVSPLTENVSLDFGLKSQRIYK